MVFWRVYFPLLSFLSLVCCSTHFIQDLLFFLSFLVISSCTEFAFSTSQWFSWTLLHFHFFFLPFSSPFIPLILLHRSPRGVLVLHSIALWFFISIGRVARFNLFSSLFSSCSPSFSHISISFSSVCFVSYRPNLPLYSHVHRSRYRIQPFYSFWLSFSVLFPYVSFMLLSPSLMSLMVASSFCFMPTFSFHVYPSRSFMCIFHVTKFTFLFLFSHIHRISFTLSFRFSYH